VFLEHLSVGSWGKFNGFFSVTKNWAHKFEVPNPCKVNMAIVPAFAQSSLAQALAAEVGEAMRNVDPMDVIRSARKVQKAFRGYKARKAMPARKRARATGPMKRVYTGVKNASAKIAQGVPTGAAFQIGLGDLVISDFAWPQNAGNTDITRRESNQIHVKGIKLCRQFQYARVAGAGDVGNIEVHWALLQLKNDEDNTELTTELNNNFFRDNANATQRSTAFPTYTAASPWHFGMNCWAINPNNKVRVLTHRKRVLAAVTPESNANGTNIWKIEEYMKINKDFSFKANESDLPSQRIFECYWANTVTPFEFPADPTSPQYIETDKLHTVYYGNTIGKKCC